jgi:propionate catabolism operon transcriptional regulator
MTSGKLRSPRICVLSYNSLSQMVHTVVSEFVSRAEIEVVEVLLDQALTLGLDIEKNRRADVIITAGANAVLLRSALSLPVVAIKVTGFDFLLALQRARKVSDRIGVGVFRQKSLELETVKELLQVQVAQQTYETRADAQESFQRLHDEGYQVIVGSSLVVEMAEASGLTGILIYSLESVRQAFEEAIQLAELAVLEAARYDNLNSVLRNLHEAVLAVDREHRVTAINPLMERILGTVIGSVIGRTLTEFDPLFSLTNVLSDRDEAVDVVLPYENKTYLMSRTAIRESGIVTGAILTLYDAHDIQRADTVMRSQRRPRSLTAKYHFSQVVGASPALRQARAVAQRCAQSDSTVLITGESGTGKELFAQAIHNAGGRNGKPFVALNCAAFPESLLESELFGYDDGAFTGSRKGGKAGLFETAHTGTIFLDEIGDMPVSLQTRLLRVLQEREVVRLGSLQPIPIDVRVIAATHCHLPDRIERGTFRADLYYRINILRVSLPALRDRPEDVGSLALQLLFSSLRRQGCSLPADQILAPLLPVIIRHTWPGNVRELENIMERFAVYASASGTANAIDYPTFMLEIAELSVIPAELRVVQSPVAAEFVVPIKIDKAAIISALAHAGGNKQVAAARLGISRTTLWRRIREEQLEE